MKNFRKSAWAVAFAAFVACDAVAIGLAPEILPVSTGEIKLGEWNRNFNGGLAIADAFHVPLVVFYGGLSCGKCETLQRACLTDEFLAWQNANKMVMIFTTDNLYGNASSFAKPAESDGYPFIAVYWHRAGESAPSKDSEYYKAFCGRDGQMLATGGSLASQLIRSIETVTTGYVHDPTLDEAIAEHAEMVYLTPVTTRLWYDVSAYTSIDMAATFAPQRVYNVSEAYKITLKKISGTLPAGVKLVCSEGQILLTGAAKTAGHFPYTFSIQQKRSIVTHEGPPITIDIVVHAANDVASGGNALLGSAFNATVPLFLSEAGGKALKGVLDVGHTARNRITAKYSGLPRKTIPFSGAWSLLSDGVAQAVLTARDGSVLVISLGAGGAIEATLSDPAYPEALSSGVPLFAGTGSFASAFAGSYTIGLPESGNESAGAGYVVVKRLSANGKAQWTAGLPNGVTISGASTLTTDGEGNAVLPIFKCMTKDYVAVPVRIKPNASMGTSPRAVASCAGAIARWGHVANPVSSHDCEVFGSYYDKSFALEESCRQQYATSVLALSAATSGFVSGRYGAVASVPSGDVQIAGSAMTLTARTADLKLSFVKSTGMVKGSMKVSFASGATTAKFVGVVVPGWHGTAEPGGADPFAIDGSRPFAIGAAYFADVEGGVQAKRGFMVKIDEGNEQ